MAVLAILEADARVAARLSTALGSDHRVVVNADWDSLCGTLSLEAFDGCLVDVDHPDRGTAIRQIACLQQAHPGMAIIASVEAGYDLGYYDLGELGIAGIVVCRPQPPTRIRSEVDRALAAARADRITRSLENRFAPPGPHAIGWAVEHAGRDTNVRKLAAALGHTPRSLGLALEDAGMPSPTRVLLWGRLLLAGARLGRDGRTVEDVAFSLGYSTATSLARAMKSQTGLTPGEVSEEGGMERVRDALFPERKGRGLLGKIASLVLLTALTGCATLGVGGAAFDRQAIDETLDVSPLGRGYVGVLAVDASTGRTLYAHNPDRWFVPASNQKILVTAAAWSVLGPEHRYRTELWATGPVLGRRLEGDLWLLGSGDPSLSARYWESGVRALDALADSVRQRGVAQVAGALRVDVSTWDSTTVAPTREVGDLAFGYGATGGAFAIDEGELRVIVRGAVRPPAPADVEWIPHGGDGYLRAHITTTAPDSSTRVAATYLPESRQLVLEGVVPAGFVDTLSFAQRDPVRLAAGELADALDRAGIRIEGGLEIRWKPEGGPFGPGCARARPAVCGTPTLLAALESPPVEELVAGILEPSQNWMAEQLVRTLGAERGDFGSLDEGLSLMLRFLADEVGVDTLDVRPRDGSGLSAYNLVTPRALVQILRHMGARSDGDAFRRAMAEPGEEDSTLEDRLEGLEGRVFAKTGSISNVNALSGYLVRENGREVIFSILVNATGAPDEAVRAAIDNVVRLLAR